MRKIWKITKKLLVWVLMFVVTFNPFIPVIAYAEEEILASPSPSLSPSPSPTVIMETGDAVAISESESQVNTTQINSQVDTVIVPVTEESPDLIEPFPISSPTPIPSLAPSPSPTPSPNTPAESISEEVSVTNTANNETSAVATATTGSNSQESDGSVSMTTGDSAALATSLSLTNTTLIDSTLQVGVIAILQNWNGDIILDPPTTQGGESDITSTLLNSLQVSNGPTTVTSVATASAMTGDNTQVASGSATLTAGSATAIAESNVIVNTTVIGADIFNLITENEWLWTGNILNWEYPGSISSPGSISNMSSSSVGCSGSCNMSATVNNQADVSTVATATSSTGLNTQITGGEAIISTGNAMAGAVATSLVNTTLINARYRLLSLLLFAPWSGNLIFAYPDLELYASGPLQVYEGEEITFNVSLKNRGYGSASNVNFVSLITSGGNVVYDQNEVFGELDPKEEIVRTIKIPTTGRAGQTIELSVLATNGTVEESDINNNSFVSTVVLAKSSSENKESNSDNESDEVPKLTLNSKTNINEFVYPGDSVTFDMQAYNDGPIGAKNVVLIQKLMSPDGEQISEFRGKVGEIALNQTKNIRFVVSMSKELEPGEYYTESHLYGESDRGTQMDSSQVHNAIPLRLKNMAIQIVGKVLSVETVPYVPENSVLGATAPIKCGDCTSLPWYAAISLGSIAYYLMTFRRRELASTLRWGITLPLSSYAGLVLSNPSCSKGIIMLSDSPLCAWFLPISYGIYLGTMGTSHIVRNLNKVRLPAVESFNRLFKVTN